MISMWILKEITLKWFETGKDGIKRKEEEGWKKNQDKLELHFSKFLFQFGFRFDWMNGKITLEIFESAIFLFDLEVSSSFLLGSELSDSRDILEMSSKNLPNIPYLNIFLI